MTGEICGDVPLTPRQRVLYLAGNLVRNLAGFAPLLASLACPGTPRAGAMSPLRMCTDHFLTEVLPAIEARRVVDVPGIGYGSGSLCRRLAHHGFSGRYTGLDMADRFDHAFVPGFEKRFVRADAMTWQPDAAYDLVISVSALEHIADDRALGARIRTWLRPGGRQVHVVPAGWALPLYPWHSYRQYSRRASAGRFPLSAGVNRLGGVMGFLVHSVIITLGEMVLNLPVRRRWGRLCDRMLSCSRVDVVLGCRPSNVYAIVERRP